MIMDWSLFNMKDYSKTIIYKIVCNITGEVYYGHTTLTLEKRLFYHKKPSNPCRSKQIIERGNYRIDLLEHYPCANVKEAHAREGWWIENNPHVNKQIPGRTKKEYYEANRDHTLAKQKAYNEANRDRVLAQQKEYKAQNAERISQQRKEYRARQDKQAVRERDRAYELANAEAISARKRAYYKWKMSMDNMHRVAIDLFD